MARWVSRERESRRRGALTDCPAHHGKISRSRRACRRDSGTVPAPGHTIVQVPASAGRISAIRPRLTRRLRCARKNCPSNCCSSSASVRSTRNRPAAVLEADLPMRHLDDGRSVEEALTQEREHLRAMPAHLPATCRVVARVADKFGHVHVDRVTYSVPIRHAYRPVWVKLSSVNGSNPAICGHRKSGHFGVPRRELSFTSRHPVFARLSGSWCASSAARTSARARDGAGGRATR